MEMIVLGSAKRAKEKGGMGMGMGKGEDKEEGESSSMGDLFAAVREAIKSGDDEAGAEALKEFFASCGSESEEE
jgi:hypothetical protein